MEVMKMKKSKNILTEKEMELVELLMSDCQSTGDIQAKLKRLFAGTIEQMLEAEMDEHLGYDKNSVLGNNSGNSRNGYNQKTIISDYGASEIAVPRDRNGEFEPRVLEKRQVRTDEIEQKILAMYSKGMSQRDIEDTIREIYECVKIGPNKIFYKTTKSTTIKPNISRSEKFTLIA
jgi:putative transposase